MWESGSELMLVYKNGEKFDGLLGETVSQLMTAYRVNLDIEVRC